MPRKNKRKIYTAGKTALFCNETAASSGCKPECDCCAFAGYGGVCMTSDGECLKTVPVYQIDDDAAQRRADTIM